MNNVIRITVPLRLHEFERLRDIANNERRHTREQAAYMLSKLLGEQSQKMTEPESQLKGVTMREFVLLVDLPFLKKGRHFFFDDDTALVYAVLDDEVAEYPLRAGLSGYLWLLMTDNGHLEEVIEELPNNE